MKTEEEDAHEASIPARKARTIPSLQVPEPMPALVSHPHKKPPAKPRDIGERNTVRLPAIQVMHRHNALGKFVSHLRRRATSRLDRIRALHPFFTVPEKAESTRNPA